MLQLRTSLRLLGFAITFALAGAARAAEPVENAPDKVSEKAGGDDSAAHLKSLELMIRPTFGGAGGGSLVRIGPGLVGNTSKIFDGSASPYGASFGVGGEVGFRFHPLVSAGLRGDLATVSATAPNDGSTELSRSRQSAGFYLRAYPLALNESIRKHIDPWFATGVVYMHDAQTFHMPAATNSGATVDATVKLEHHGVGVPLAMGIDYRLTRALSIGPSFEYTLLFPIAGCATLSALGQSNEICSNGSGASRKAVLAESTGAWTAGLDLRFTPF